MMVHLFHSRNLSRDGTFIYFTNFFAEANLRILNIITVGHFSNNQ